METDSNCIFCKIVRKEIPAEVVYEDGETMAFLDINPNSHGHTLVIPKGHFENIYTVPAEEWARTMLTVQKIAPAVKMASQADGLNIVMNNEAAAYQEIPHAHIHLIPRHFNDNFPHFPYKPYIGEEIKEIAAKIREEIT